LIPELVVKGIVNVIESVIFIVLFILGLLGFSFLVHVSVEVFFHFEVGSITAFITIPLIFWGSFILFLFTLVIFEAFQLLFVLDLVSYVFSATFAVANSLAIGFLIALAFTTVVLIIFIFFATEVLVDEVQKDTLGAVTEFAEGVHHSYLRFNYELNEGH
jgi:hypothetical protein